MDRRHFPLTEPVSHRKCNFTIIRIFKLAQIQARAANFLKDLLMKVKVIYFEDCKCLLRLLAEPWGIGWSPGKDRRGRGSAWAGGWSSAGAWGCHPHTALLAEPLSPPRGLGELECKPLPYKLHLGLLILYLSPWTGGLGSAVGFTYTLNWIPRAQRQRFVPLIQAMLHNSASFSFSKSSNSLETFTGVTLTQSNPFKILWAFAASLLFSIFELLNLGTAVDRCLED